MNSYFDFPLIFDLGLPRFRMTHDVIDSVARLIFLFYADFGHLFVCQCLVQKKWSIHSYTGRITPFKLTAATSSEIVRKFNRFNLWIFWSAEHILFSKLLISITLCQLFWSNLEIFRMEIQNASTTRSKSAKYKYRMMGVWERHPSTIGNQQ